MRGGVLYCPDERFLYDTALETIREYDAFKHRLDDYLGVQAIGLGVLREIHSSG
ncbi:hypothetical protein [Methanogenium sp. MK-MG]|uniref:hypothetical protein n=1 Tax=Methanogenium sp. MK-MG TaxID=2599926 RepID=UPI0020B17654|nr:hypothetical protein [Methanogenium sp. MK-MG]KAF1078013.1 hypothetical protein MKMG_01054 [Methanogenium sp. MK-MG]